MISNKNLENHTLQMSGTGFPMGVIPPLKLAARNTKGRSQTQFEQLYRLGTAQGRPMESDFLRVLDITH